MGIETEQGVYQRYNGIDVTQTRDYIKVGCETYIDRVLLSHGWDAPKVKDPPNLVPISTDTATSPCQTRRPVREDPGSEVSGQTPGFLLSQCAGRIDLRLCDCMP